MQLHTRTRVAPKGTQRKSVSRTSDGSTAYTRTARTHHSDAVKATTVPLKRASRVTDRLHPLLAESRVSQDSTTILNSPAISESDASKRLASRTAALTLQSENGEVALSKQVGQKQQNEAGNEQNQFLPPIK